MMVNGCANDAYIFPRYAAYTRIMPVILLADRIQSSIWIVLGYCWNFKWLISLHCWVFFVSIAHSAQHSSSFLFDMCRVRLSFQSVCLVRWVSKDLRGKKWLLSHTQRTDEHQTLAESEILHLDKLNDCLPQPVAWYPFIAFHVQ